MNKSKDLPINTISIDSRTALGRYDEVFFAFKGNHLNGHDFIPELLRKGTKNFVVSEVIAPQEDVNIIYVKDILTALQLTAKYKRDRFKGRVIGITGSNGKTIIKEWLATLIENEYSLVKSPGSYNSQIGVALSAWQLNEKADFGIFEAGISKPNEMPLIKRLIEPHIGIFTNIGSAHQENFETVEAKIKEKLKLFQNTETLIVRADQSQVFNLVKAKYRGDLISWSSDRESKDHVFVDKNGEVLDFYFKNKKYSFQSSFNDEASIENLIHVIITAAFLGLSEMSIQNGINNLVPLKMRLRAIKGSNGNYIIDDSYTNDFGGLIKALDFMEKQNLQNSRVLILSDFGSTSNSGEDLKQLAQLLSNKKVTTFIGIGELLTQYAHLFPKDALFFSNTQHFLNTFSLEGLKNKLILVKGSRRFRFEKIVSGLSQRLHKTSLEINLDSIVNNLSVYKSRLKPTTKIMVMVKALAYGSGSTEIARILEYQKVDYLAVAYTDEGKELRENGISLPIMVMNANPDDGQTLATYNLEPEIFSIEQLQSFLQDFRFLGKPLNIHLVLNTGMNRLGFGETEVLELNDFLADTKDVIVKGVFSHLAAADEELHQNFTIEQVSRFKALSSKIKINQPEPPLKHILNSSGIAAYSQFQMDMVRLGIGLYGIDPTSTMQNDLIFPSQFKTTISQIREVKKGESIGYGRNGLVKRDSKIATIAVGYADGYARLFGNGNAQVMVNGQLAPTIGNICMDMSMIDVTDLNAKEGDEIILFGERPSVQELAKIAGTIPYEILTNVSSRVSRVFYAE